MEKPNTGIGVSKYRQVADELAGRIKSGDLAPGSRLPSDRQLARNRKLSVTTATAALNELVRRGLACRRRGSGTFVSMDPLALNRRLRIGFLHLLVRSIYAANTVAHLWHTTEEYHCDLIPLVRTPEELEDAVRDYSLDALLVFNRSVSSEVISHLQALNIPFLLLNSLPDENPRLGIGYSPFQIISEAVDYLIGLGHRDIGFAIANNPREIDTVYEIRYKTFCKVMYDHSLPMNPEWALYQFMSVESWKKFFSSSHLPSALIIGNSSALPSFCQAVYECKLKLPDVMSVLVIGEWHGHIKHPIALSCIRIDQPGIARAGLQTILRRLGVEVTIDADYNKLELVDNGTCGPPGYAGGRN